MELDKLLKELVGSDVYYIINDCQVTRDKLEREGESYKLRNRKFGVDHIIKVVITPSLLPQIHLKEETL